MNLHEDKDAFKEIIEAAASEFNFEEFQIEKDYYVSLMLQKLSLVSPDIVFKGGTSLSKCYDVIHRFSEDIDINIKVDDSKPTRGQKRAFKENILQSINDVGFKLINDDMVPPVETRSNRDFNMYLVGYDREFTGGTHMVNHIIIETNVTYKAFPCENLEVSNYITKYLKLQDQNELIDQYNLHPFTMKIQTINRTFIDKLFALCDYHEGGVYDRYSRHLYDIHMIWQSGLVELENLKKLIPEIVEVRKPGPNTISCKPGYQVEETLKEIIERNVYKEDFNTNTKEFLSKDVSYEEAIKSLAEIIQSELMPKIIE